MSESSEMLSYVGIECDETTVDELESSDLREEGRKGGRKEEEKVSLSSEKLLPPSISSLSLSLQAGLAHSQR